MANKPYSARQHTSDPKVVEARLRHDLSYARRVIDELYIKTATADLLREAEWYADAALNMVADLERYLAVKANEDVRRLNSARARNIYAAVRRS